MACKCGVDEGRLHRPGCDLAVFPMEGGPDMTPAQARTLNRIYRRDYTLTVRAALHLWEQPDEPVATWETWADQTTSGDVFVAAYQRRLPARVQGIELEPSRETALIDADVRIYPCADGCGAEVVVSGPYAALLGPTEVGWFLTEHAPKGIAHHGPRFKTRARA